MSELIKAYKVDEMSPNLVEDLAPLVMLMSRLHRGTDHFGNRITPKERKVIEKTIEELQDKIISKHSDRFLRVPYLEIKGSF